MLSWRGSLLVNQDPNKPYTLFMDALKCGSTVLTQEHTTVIDGKTSSHQHPISYVSGFFQGIQLNWAALTKETYVIYGSWEIMLLSPNRVII